jgi:hypothetical protein
VRHTPRPATAGRNQGALIRSSLVEEAVACEEESSNGGGEAAGGESAVGGEGGGGACGGAATMIGVSLVSIATPRAAVAVAVVSASRVFAIVVAAGRSGAAIVATTRTLAAVTLREMCAVGTETSVARLILYDSSSKVLTVPATTAT